MATRAIEVHREPAPGWGERVALPAGGILTSLALVAALAVALASLPADRPAIAPVSTEDAALAVRAPALQARAVEALDPIAPLDPGSRPMSAAPVGGLAFVRCTNLWISHADGSSAHRVLSMAGLSSPAFSPDARTIAVFGSTDVGIELSMVAADGSEVRALGTLREDGRPVAATPAGLTWSPNGSELAFALSGPGPAWSIWTLELATGAFTKAGTGAPAPAYLGRSLLDARMGTASDFRVLSGRARWTARQLSGPFADRAVSSAPGWWKDEWASRTATVAVGPRGVAVLTVRPGPYRKRASARTFGPPPGFAIDASVRPAVVQGGPVVVTLLGADGARDLGLLDPGTDRWITLDYAWDPVVSPAPPATGTLGASRAISLVQHLLWRWNRRSPDTALVLVGREAAAVTAFDDPGFTLASPRRHGDAWRVPATLFGTTVAGYGIRRVTFVVHPTHGRLTVRVGATGDLRPIRTIDDAFRALRSMVTGPILPLPPLPAGTTLQEQAIYASTWDGVTVGQLNLRVPAPGRDGSLTFNFGEAGFGCIQPVPTTLSTGTQAIATDPALANGGYNQVAWPVDRRRATSGPYGISGDLPRETILAMAAAMDRSRLAAT